MDSQTQCLLLRLPAELRLQSMPGRAKSNFKIAPLTTTAVYEYCLRCSEQQLAGLRPLTTRKHLSSYLIPSLDICPNILRTCRRIHDEAAPLLYKSNVFCAHPTQLKGSPFLVASDRAVYYSRFKTHITKWYISLRLDIDPRLQARDVEAAFSGVDSLEVEVWQTMFGTADTRVLKLFEGVRGIGHVTIQGSVSRGYSEWLATCMASPCGSVFTPFVEATQPHEWDMWTHGNR